MASTVLFTDYSCCDVVYKLAIGRVYVNLSISRAYEGPKADIFTVSLALINNNHQKSFAGRRNMNQQRAQDSSSVVLCSVAAPLEEKVGEHRASIDSDCKQLSGCRSPLHFDQVRFPPPSCNGSFDIQPDFYQDDGTDVGPRCHMEQIQVDPQSSWETKLEFMDAVATFNLGLAHHGQKELNEAATYYEAVLYYVYGLLQTLSDHEPPSTTLLQLGMHSHTNLGAIAYSLADENDTKTNVDAALIFARQLLHKKKLQQHLPVIASVVSNWCRVHWMRGDIEADALFNCMEEVLRLRTESLPWYHVDVAASHLNLAAAYHARGQVEAAVTHCKEYLEIATYHVRSDVHQVDPIPALIYLLLVQFEDKEDSVSQDLARALRALQDKRQEQGNTSAEVASVLNYIGTLLFHLKEYDNALFFFQEELRIESDLDERDRVSLSVSCNNIGRTLQEQGKLKQAMFYYKRALSADFTEQGEYKSPASRSSQDSTTTNLFSTVWYNLGLIHDKLGASTEAIRAFQISLDLRKLILGSMHPDIACLWYNIGVLQMERSFLDDAQKSFRQAIAIRAECQEHQLSDDRVFKTLQKLCSLQKGKGNLRGAVSSLEQICTLFQQSTSFHPVQRQTELSRVFYRMAELYHDLNERESSFVMARAAVEAVEAVTPTLLSEVESQVSATDKLATVEQWALSHLLVGSLLHENCESQQAYLVLQQLGQTLDRLVQHSILSTSSLLSLRQVVERLAVPQCAPEA